MSAKALPQVERRLLGYALAAEYLGISKRQMEQLARDNEVVKVTIGHRVLFDRADLDAYVDRLKAAAS
jgi:excisionase family DNA binding protein